MHSHYRRQLTDMSCAGRRVRFILHVRKFFCDEKTCVRKIFTERLVPFIQPWARVTTRFFQAMGDIGLATSGMLRARLGDRLGMPASWMTILRRVMARPEASVDQVVQLGIDDFSFRRGRKFGTILVDMQSHRVIDLLADREAETAAAWMRAHPEIHLVSRDRGGDYASAAAATAGAPQAVQCADRFHVIKNLREALEGVLAHHLAQERKRQTQVTAQEASPAWRAKRAPRYAPKLEQLQQARRQERMALYEQVIALHQQGLSQQAIAERVSIGHRTISRWLAEGRFPERKPREQASQLDRYLPYLYKRWAAGCHNMSELFRELGAQGLCWLLSTSVLKIGSLCVIDQVSLPKHVSCEYNQRDPFCSYSPSDAPISRRRGSIRALCIRLNQATNIFQFSRDPRTFFALDKAIDNLTFARNVC